MKRGSLFSFSPLILIVILGILAISCAAAYNGFGYGFGGVTFAELAENPWANAALIFLLVFSVSLFVLKDVFKRSYGAAVVIALVIGIIGSIGLIAAYGPIITKVGPWVLVLFLAIIALSLWRFFKGSNLIWILFVLALLWLLWARNQLCGPGMLLPEEACIVLNFLAIAIAIIAILMIFWHIINWLRRLPPPAIGRRPRPKRVVSAEEQIATDEKVWERQKRREMASVNKKFIKAMRKAKAEGRVEDIPVLEKRRKLALEAIQKKSATELHERRVRYNIIMEKWKKQSIDKRKLERAHGELKAKLDDLIKKIRKAEEAREKFKRIYGPKEGIMKEDIWITRTLTKENYNAAADIERRMKKIKAILKKYY